VSREDLGSYAPEPEVEKAYEILAGCRCQKEGRCKHVVTCPFHDSQCPWGAPSLLFPWMNNEHL
jgi:hypothetical protein